MLSYTVNYGIGTYTERKLANTVWSLLESYCFGSFERNFLKINWFDTEERKDLMANIVLNNEGYAEKLGYGNETGSMDYLFAARLAVLTFVDWVDRTYVENTWISSLAAAFGVNIRLADLVNQVFDISGFVLSSIRSQLNNAWEGIKTASSFISNNLILPMINGIVNFLDYLMDAVVALDSLSDIFTITKISNGISINGIPVQIVQNGLDISIIVDKLIFHLDNFLVFTEISGFETLSIGEELADKHQLMNVLSEVALLVMTMFYATDLIHMMQIFNLFLISTIVILISINIIFASDVLKRKTEITTEDEKNKYFESMIIFHGFGFLGFLSSFVMAKAVTTKVGVIIPKVEPGVVYAASTFRAIPLISPLKLFIMELLVGLGIEVANTYLDDGTDIFNYSIFQILNFFLGVINLLPVFISVLIAPIYGAQLFILVEILNKALAIFNAIMLVISYGARYLMQLQS
jgi:hypothetical protein